MCPFEKIPRTTTATRAIHRRLIGYGRAVEFHYRVMVPHITYKWRLRELAAYSDRDIYRETVEIMGYDPLS